MLMNKITFEEYKSAIKSQYEEKKSVDVSGILLNPTPAQLRNLCLMMFDNLLSKSDENIFKLFFNVKEQESLRRSMENSDIARFRPIISFLKGEKDSEHTIRIELAAILIDFNPRPYNKYLLNGKILGSGNLVATSLVEEKESVSDCFSEEIWPEKVALEENNNEVNKSKVLFLTVFLSLFFIGYIVKDMILPEKNCMKWEGNHYEAVDCKNEKLGIGNITSVAVLNEELLSFKKIEVSANTIFFKKGKPIVWYGKSVEGKYEYFNEPGLHPETDKTLKPISIYIIKKYIHR